MQYLIDHNYWLYCFKYFSFRYKEAAVQRLYFQDGIYEGQVHRPIGSEPEMHGIGMYLSNKGDLIFGEFKQNNLNGEVNMLLYNGSFYRGGFKNGLYDGLGVLISVDKDVYLLSFRNGLLNGCITYFPKSGKEVFIIRYKDNVLKSVFKRYRLSTEHGEEVKYRVIKSVFENSQLNEILYTATDVQKIVKKVSTNRQKFVNSQMVGKEFLYCGIFNNELEFEGLGLLIDLENKKIRIGDWDKQVLNGFGVLVQTKYMFKGNFENNQLEGEILITNLETSEYKICLYKKGAFISIVKEGKGNFPYKGFEYPAPIDVAGQLARYPGSEYVQSKGSSMDMKNFGYDLLNIRIKANCLEDFLSSKGIKLQESQLLIAVKDDDTKKHRSKSPYKRVNTQESSNGKSISIFYHDFERPKSTNKAGSETNIVLDDSPMSFRDFKDSESRFIKISPDNGKGFKKQGKNVFIDD